ncbi:thioredoxin-like [Aphis gossypii]|uniref:thioredoxin-like n=1 Tax=Aphis gossypii TaxID=80765 RepID=UPI002158B073|nr:thioredoxin-like [Aphis gossypii]
MQIHANYMLNIGAKISNISKWAGLAQRTSQYANPVYQPPPPLNVEMVQLITKAADLATTLSNAGDNLVIIDFFSNWCGSCKSMDPCINKLAKEYPHVVMLKFDVSVNEETEQVSND